MRPLLALPRSLNQSNVNFNVAVLRHVARIVSLGAASVLGGADIFRVLLYCYSLLAVTEYTNIVEIQL